MVNLSEFCKATFLVASLCIFGSISCPSSSAAETSKPAYTIVKRWPIPNGGEGKVIVIPAKVANEAGITNLAQTLIADTKDDRNAFIFIFDDLRAAKMRDRVLEFANKDSLTTKDKQDEKYFDKHFVGDYSRNANTGNHTITILVGGKEKIVDLK